MLTQLLTELAQRESLSLVKLSRQVGWTAEETIAGLEQLVRMGYVSKEEMGRTCGVCSGDNHCDTCAGAEAAGPLPAWYLTKKGKSYLAKREKAE